MKQEELLQMLRDAGMQDEEIKTLLSEALAALEPAPAAEPEGGMAGETEEEKADRIFGAI